MNYKRLQLKIQTSHQSLQTQLRIKCTNIIDSAWIRFLDQLSYYVVKVQWISGIEVKLTDYLSGKPQITVDTETPIHEEYKKIT